jgi:hypothetical protein
MSVKSIAKTSAIALLAVAVANHVPQLKEIINGDSGWF